MKVNHDSSLFIRLLVVSLIIVFLAAGLLIYFSHTSSFLIIVSGLGIVFSLLVAFLLLILLKYVEYVPQFKQPLIKITKLLYPVVLVLGTVFRIEKDDIRASFIGLHNRLTQLQKVKVKPEQILLLLPHCLQNADCMFKVTNNVENCRRCGKCIINDLLALKEKYGINMAIATGGTLARRRIEEIQPQVVIAVACERDLASGISDIAQVYVLGITNKRPNGPCYNTTVDLGEIEKAIQFVL